MKILTCASTGRRLQAYHDGELSVSDQIDVDAHLEWCDQCAAALEEMRMLRSALRTALPGRQAWWLEETNVSAAVISRIRAEDTASWPARLRAMFEDMHMVYAGLGAGTATVVCVMILLSMMRFATNSDRSPGSNQNPVVVDARMLMPRPLEQVLMTAAAKEDADDAAFTLSAVVTREGRVVNLELHGSNGRTLGADSSEARALESLLGTVSRARFEPAKVAGLPVAVNMVWMVAHTTVRAAKAPLQIENAIPAARKRSVVNTAVGPSTPRRPVVA